MVRSRAYKAEQACVGVGDDEGREASDVRVRLRVHGARDAVEALGAEAQLASSSAVLRGPPEQGLPHAGGVDGFRIQGRRCKRDRNVGRPARCRAYAVLPAEFRGL